MSVQRSSAPQLLQERWRATLGAVPEARGTRFRVWGPAAGTLDVVLASPDEAENPSGKAYPLRRDEEGLFSGVVPDLLPGAWYWYRLDGERLLPDPASRYQPRGVHGPSAVVDPGRYRWTDGHWQGIRPDRLAIYELHVGAFTTEGTFEGVESRLDYLASLGISAIELMPIAEFAGRWNWGYDGVDLFAPSHRYGTPDGLRRLVDAAHRRGMGVILDVVYNHLGPDGAYLSAFSADYFTSRHKSPWGDSVNFDGPGSEHVREFFVENALYWINEYHLDGLRLDATHALKDDSARHFLAELASRVRDQARNPEALLIAEDERNLDRLVRPATQGGYGLDALWSDDFHHELRRLVAGDREGYFEKYRGTTADLAETIDRGWFFVGQSPAPGAPPRGTDPTGIPPQRFVFCLQNHDQVGNRALGDRLHHRVEPAAYRAASALLLCLPQTPLLFMGQEWAASSPFLYFTDHEADLGRAVTEGRRAEFAAFSAFADPDARARIPDPQDERAFTASRLAWDELDEPPHRGVRRLYEALLRLRRSEPALRPGARSAVEAIALDEGTVAVWRRPDRSACLLIVARLVGAGTVEIPAPGVVGHESCQVILTTEDHAFCEDGAPPRVEPAAETLHIRFERPAAVLLRLQS